MLHEKTSINTDALRKGMQVEFEYRTIHPNQSDVLTRTGEVVRVSKNHETGYVNSVDVQTDGAGRVHTVHFPPSIYADGPIKAGDYTVENATGSGIGMLEDFRLPDDEDELQAVTIRGFAEQRIHVTRSEWEAMDEDDRLAFARDHYGKRGEHVRPTTAVVAYRDDGEGE